MKSQFLLNLAIDDIVYEEFFQRKSIQAVASENQLLLIVIDMKKEEIQQWIT
jgi:XisH protein